MNAQELAEITRASQSALQAEFQQLPDELMLRPGIADGWTAKDVMAHVSAWERMFISWIEAFERGEKPDRPEFASDEWTDRVNARVYEEHREQPLADVRAEAAASHQAILAFVQRLGDGLFDPARFPWTQGREIAPWLRANADEHYDEHREQLAKWRSEQG